MAPRWPEGGEPASQWTRVREKIEKTIDAGADRVRFYRLCAECVRGVELLGEGTVEADVEVFVV